MCHLLLLLPLVALPVFWLLPPILSIPIYTAVLSISGGVYWLALRTMHRPVETGTEALLNSRGEVIQADHRPLRVRVHGEIWNAKSQDRLHKGDRISVVGVEGLVLTVTRVDAPAANVGRAEGGESARREAARIHGGNGRQPGSSTRRLVPSAEQ